MGILLSALPSVLPKVLKASKVLKMLPALWSHPKALYGVLALAIVGAGVFGVKSLLKSHDRIVELENQVLEQSREIQELDAVIGRYIVDLHAAAKRTRELQSQWANQREKDAREIHQVLAEQTPESDEKSMEYLNQRIDALKFRQPRADDIER